MVYTACIRAVHHTGSEAEQIEIKKKTMGIKEKAVAGGLVLAIAGTLSVSAVYLPFYSQQGQQRSQAVAKEREAEIQQRIEQRRQSQSRSRSMWKNLDNATQTSKADSKQRQ